MARVRLAIAVAVVMAVAAGCSAPPRPHGLLGIAPEPRAVLASQTQREGTLGLSVAEATAGGLDAMADEAAGLVVEAVTPGGPADLAGIRAGDTILALDGIAVRWRDAFQGREANLLIGFAVNLSVRRGDGVSTIVLKPVARAERRPLPPPTALVEERLAGIAVRAIARPPTATARALPGVELLSLSRESPWRDELEPGDELLRAAPPGARWDDGWLFSPRELLDTIARVGPGGALELTVIRPPDPEQRTIEVSLRAPPRVRDVNLLYALRYERDGPSTDVEALFYFFRYRSNPKETRINILWLLSFAWAGDEALTAVR